MTISAEAARIVQGAVAEYGDHPTQGDTKKLIRAALYLRQSQALNDDEAAVRRQEEVCREAAGPRGLDIVAVYRDNDVSATSNKSRPAYVAMLEAWKRGEFEAIICYDLDRLYRKPRDLEDLIDLAERRGLIIHTVTGEADLSTDNGRLFARIKAAVAKAETERKSARQKLRNLQDAKEGRGYWIGRRRPFGYNKDGTIFEPEADAIRYAYSAIIAGQGLFSIARHWNDELGLRTPKVSERTGGNLWSVNTIKQVLKAERNMAIRVYQGMEIPGNWEPIVDEATWRTANTILIQRAHALGIAKRPSTGLLSWVAVCAVCGRRMVGSTNKQGNKTYRCEGQPAPGERGAFGATKSCLNRLQEPIDKAVTAAVLEVLSGPEAPSLLVDKEKPDLPALVAEREQIRVKMQEIMTDFYDLELITRAQFIEKNEAYKKRLSDLEGLMVHHGKQETLGELVRADDTRSVWDRLPLDRKRQVIRELFRVEVLPRVYGAGGRSARSFELVSLVDA
jgi:DNA invertase Pin-like site-specific DNA recombinase